jgi:Pyridoxamine 5'-phosphate oxidase
MGKVAGKVTVIAGSRGDIGLVRTNVRRRMMQPTNEAIDLTPYAAAVNDALAHRRPAFVATSGEDGMPDIGPKGSVFVADTGHLAYLEYTGGGHLANFRRNAELAF